MLDKPRRVKKKKRENHKLGHCARLMLGISKETKDARYSKESLAEKLNQRKGRARAIKTRNEFDNFASGKIFSCFHKSFQPNQIISAIIKLQDYF